MAMRFLKYFAREKNGMFIVYDRFTFDNLFRLLLAHGYDHENGMDFMLANCSFSALVWQERIYNRRYLKLRAEDALSPREAGRRTILISDLLSWLREAQK
jgi:hypothetical protein